MHILIKSQTIFFLKINFDKCFIQYAKEIKGTIVQLHKSTTALQGLQAEGIRNQSADKKYTLLFVSAKWTDNEPQSPQAPRSLFRILERDRVFPHKWFFCFPPKTFLTTWKYQKNNAKNYKKKRKSLRRKLTLWTALTYEAILGI